jgi:ABC-type phosphate transport system substrate-binding protein
MTKTRQVTRRLLLSTLLAACATLPALAADPVVLVIGHPSLPKLDATTVQRLYTGRTIEVAGQPVTVVNAAPGSALRQRFLAIFLQQDDEQYRAYWTVRRHVGKGVPPRDLASSAEVIGFVQGTPGAVGYIDASELRSGLNVIARP